MIDKKEKNNIVKKRLGIFIDGANIYYASKQAGWKLDIEKVKILFESIFDIQVFNYYAALPSESDTSYADSKKYLSIVEKFAKVVTKPLKYINGQKKGNVDIEISLDVVRNLENLDEVMVFSGDSDYFELWKYVFVEKGKKIRFVSFKNNLAFELKNHSSNINPYNPSSALIMPFFESKSSSASRLNAFLRSSNEKLPEAE